MSGREGGEGGEGRVGRRRKRLLFPSMQMEPATLMIPGILT